MVQNSLVEASVMVDSVGVVKCLFILTRIDREPCCGKNKLDFFGQVRKLKSV